MHELKIEQCIAAVFGIFVALALVLSPSVAFAADTWNPHTMANTIDAGTGVDVSDVDTDSESTDLGWDDDESSTASSHESLIQAMEDVMTSSTTMIIGNFIIGAVSSIIGIVILLLFVVLCGTLINRIRCLCEHPSQAHMYDSYTNKLIFALVMAILCEIVIAIVWFIA